MTEQQNGNTQLNGVRNEFNERLRKKSYLGKANRIIWTNQRRYRTI